ncbi:IS21-like element helper ATPase IstB [Treponema primitia]|uniref:IS21-like element helper ATPase IstB n=1 Tax=Treponema primitia TaxID=88058 RepID=UPI003980AC2E
MLNKTTINQLHDLHLSAMAAAFIEQQEQPGPDTLPFDERLALLVEAEWLAKRSKRINRLVTQAGFRFPAVIEDIDYQGKHGISKPDVQRLCEGSYLRNKQNILITGPTGVGKTYLVSAIGRAACYQGTPVTYIRVPDFFVQLSDAQMEGRFTLLRNRLATVPLLILDDWGLRKFTLEESHEIMELFERRYDAASTIISGQLPCSAWHGLFPDPTLADAILDRVVHNAHKFNISGDSMRKTLADRDPD